ncbi:MAG: excinuclease ABC subunit UvrA [Firmicutes bacterium]|nr:excinuclease ABC subunit UvrA [Dethiobacter sp.]MBS3888160.1 excinuclease ABC subunit UvrA [Bacillota bacterium]
MQRFISVRGARQHNLKNISVDIPREQLVVITGLSGSGKSSLAFDTIYAEGQRRYVESLSAYARQFLGQMDKPDVDSIEGLSPAISIDQKTTSRNPRSTVGTVTEVYDYLRLLFARVGKPFCPHCHIPIAPQTVDQIVDQVTKLPEGTRLMILAPVVRGKKGEHAKLLDELRRAGYVRARIDGEIKELADTIELAKNRNHVIEVVVDRIVLRGDIASRLADSLETAIRLAHGLVIVHDMTGPETLYSLSLACTECGFSFGEIEPRLFSFNSPFGACTACSGLGSNLEVDPGLVVPDLRKSLSDGAVSPWANSSSTYYARLYTALEENFGIKVDAPLDELSKEQREVLLYGSKERKITLDFEQDGHSRQYSTYYKGVVAMIDRNYRETTSDYIREELENYMSSRVCPACNGLRLKPEALAVRVGGKNIAEVTSLTVEMSLAFFQALVLDEKETHIARQILKEITDRLGFLVNVGLYYIAMSRKAGTLSGGEAQRIRLATQIGSSLMGVVYILDEPSIGLHQRDNERLIKTLQHLRDLGNTVIVVEHDEDTMRLADHIIDMGPGAGLHGGEVVATGTLSDICQHPASLTGEYLSGRKVVEVPAQRRQPNGKWLEVYGAAENNLRHIDVRFPLGLFVCVTGVSGSGKSTLVNEILYKRLAQELSGSKARPGAHRDVVGLNHIDKIIEIDQSPIGRTPRSNPATYTGTFELVRQLFAQTNEAKMRGYKAGRFSFNVKGGRCESCKGDGIIKIEMHFLPDVYVPCEVCKGKRYSRETLEVKFKGKNIAEVLDMTIEQALEFFGNMPRLERKVQTLYDVGLGYIKLGQPATTLSGGEAQRVKLATELARRSNGKTLYILDEPTTGLHIADIHRLLGVLNRLVEAGDTVLVIEHNLEVIKTADYLIDLGPEGGLGGGLVVASGTPEEVSRVSTSHTGHFLARVLPPLRAGGTSFAP